VCDVIERWEHGTLVRATRLPDFFSYNAVRVEGAAAVGANAVVHAADVLLGDLGHRQVEVEDEVAGARLRPGLEALGWSAERLVWMSLRGAPPGPDFDEAPFAATHSLRIEWALTVPGPSAADAAARFARVEEQAAELRGSRALLARDRAGEPTGFAVFVPGGSTAEIDQVYVRPGWRGRGIGGALVAAAARAAGAAETLIVADADGDSRRLYARLGFEPVWRQHVFTRRPG
jgi:GNAT superfamily N-acetyltransferase